MMADQGQLASVASSECMQLYIRKYNVRSYTRFNFQVTVLMDGYSFDN